MESDSYSPTERKDSLELMAKECANLLSEIERLESRRTLQSSRLKNVMDLAFATVNIEDSKHMRELTKATVHDSAAMKRVCLSSLYSSMQLCSCIALQISYLTMVFLPASFTAVCVEYLGASETLIIWSLLR